MPFQRTQNFWEGPSLFQGCIIFYAFLHSLCRKPVGPHVRHRIILEALRSSSQNHLAGDFIHANLRAPPSMPPFPPQKKKGNQWSICSPGSNISSAIAPSVPYSCISNRRVRSRAADADFPWIDPSSIGEGATKWGYEGAIIRTFINRVLPEVHFHRTMFGIQSTYPSTIFQTTDDHWGGTLRLPWFYFPGGMSRPSLSVWKSKMDDVNYSSSHNHGSGERVPTTLVSSTIRSFSTSMIMGDMGISKILGW